MQPGDTPARRPELELTAREEGGRHYTVVRDPVTGRRFQLREIEGFLFYLLDGTRSLEDVHGEVLREFPGAPLPLSGVIRFAEHLAQRGLLLGSQAAPRAIPFHRRLLRIKLPPVRVDPLLDALDPLVRVAYRPASLALGAVLILFAGYWAFFSSDELRRFSPGLHSPRGWLLLGAAILVLNLVHELGHGVTCRYYRARCEGIGFFVLYGLPAFYCDVSGAWELSSRRARICIGAAGLWWQLLFGSVVFIAWKALEPGSVPARFCHAILGMCGLTALLNLVPLLKLDGYYILSDWLRIPNLREKSLRYLGRRVAAFFVDVQVPRATPEQRRIYFWFGLLSWVATALLLGVLLTRLARFLIGQLGGPGALLMGALLMAVLFSWIRVVLAGTAASAPARSSPRNGPLPPASTGGTGGAAGVGDAGTGSPPPRTEPCPPSGNGAPADPTRDPAPPWWRRLRWGTLLVALMLAAAAWWFWTATWMLYVASPCTLEAARRTPVRPLVEGVLQEVYFREGDRVRPGDTFAVIEALDAEKRRQQLAEQAGTVLAQAEAIKGEIPVVEAENDRDAARADQELTRARTELEDRSDLYPIRRAEAERRVQEAWSALAAATRVAERAAEDERAVEAGRLTPAMQAVAERIARVRAQRTLAEREVRRAAFLVAEGALERQKLDAASAQQETLQREETALESELRALRKTLSEQAEDSRAEATRLQAAYEAALEAQRLVERETRPERLEAARTEVRASETALESTRRMRAAARVKQAQAAARQREVRPLAVEMSRLDERIAQTRVRVPVAGVVSTPRLEERIGKRFVRGETIGWIDHLETLSARIHVAEKEIAGIERGTPVQVRIGAFPDRTFEGTVEEISPRAGPGGSRGAYEVRFSIRNPTGELRPGTTGYAKILLGERPIRQVALRRLYRYIRTEVWTWF